MKTITIVMMMLLVISVIPLIAAEEVVTSEGDASDVEIVDAGITPDSPLYGLEKAMERLRVAMTFNRVEKAKLKIKYAEERLAEAEQMADEENIEAATEAQEAHDEEIADVEEIVEELESNGDEESAEGALEDVAELQEAVQTHSEKVAAIKNRILERKVAGNMSEEQLAHLTEVFDKIINKSQEMEAKIEQKRENVRTKLKVLGEFSEEDLQGIEARIKEKVGNGKSDDDADDDSVGTDDLDDQDSEDEDSLDNESEDNSDNGIQAQAGRQ